MKYILLGALTGLLSATSFAYLSVSPNHLSFGRVEINSASHTRSVWVRNYGEEETRVHIYERFCDSNYWVSDNCYWELLPGQSCQITVRYRPYREGYHNCDIDVENDDYRRTWVRVSGQGVHRR